MCQLDEVEQASKVKLHAARDEAIWGEARIESALGVIQSLHRGEYKGRSHSLLIKRTLTIRQYKKLLHCIAEDQSLKNYFDDKLRYDYNPHKKELLIRIPGRFHEHTIKVIEEGITEARGIFKRSSNRRTAEIATKLNSVGSTDIHLSRYFTKQPDASYEYVDCPDFPCLVVEVAHAQRQLGLYELAKEYIRGSKGAIRTVVGIKIGYPHPNQARFMVWHARQPNRRGIFPVNQPDIDLEFRDRNKNPVNGADLRLLLTDFVCGDVASSFRDITDEIVISSTELCEAVDYAESRLPQTQRANPVPGLPSEFESGGDAITNPTESPRTLGSVPEPRRSHRLQEKGARGEKE